jgi:hypothetical protein
MEAPYPRRRAAGALEFVAELELFALECVATGAWDDDLTARRRRQRDEVMLAETRDGGTSAKAL